MTADLDTSEFTCANVWAKMSAPVRIITLFS